MGSIAGIYSRISHDPEGRQAGVERQELDCRRMASGRGWTVREPLYRENDTSGSTRSRKRRPVFEQMLQDLEQGSIDVLLAYPTSRLTRRPLEYERLIDLTSRTGLQIHSVVSGPVRLDTADGRAIGRVLGAIDAAEAERTSERVSRAKLQRAEQGLWHGGPFTPFGYRYASSLTRRGLDLVVDEPRANLVREACRRSSAATAWQASAGAGTGPGLHHRCGLAAAGHPQDARPALSTAGLVERRGQLYPGRWPA